MEARAKKIAYVSGGTGEIGTAICQHLAQGDWQVIAGCSDAKRGESWLAEQKKRGFHFHSSVVDVSDWDAVVVAFQKIKNDFGPVQVLVNNAGITRDASFRKMTVEAWRLVLKTNLDSVFNLSKQVIDDMLACNWGRIINISSVNGQKGQFGQSNYASAKAGMHGFTMSLAQEVAHKGITVNTISPGYIATKMVNAMPKPILDQLVANVPMKRLGLPEEIASLCGWLVSDGARFATGANFALNGGLHMQF